MKKITSLAPAACVGDFPSWVPRKKWLPASQGYNVQLDVKSTREVERRHPPKIATYLDVPLEDVGSGCKKLG